MYESIAGGNKRRLFAKDAQELYRINLSVQELIYAPAQDG
jgi:hypothetical protein